MLNDFTINYRGVEITPHINHKFDGDTLQYDWGDYHVEVMFDITHYDSPTFKKAYIKNVKYVAEQGLNELRARDINRWYDKIKI